MTTVTVVTQVPFGAEPESWTWKYYLVDGILKLFTDSEDESYTNGVEDGFAMIPGISVQQIMVDDLEAENHWGPDTATAEEQNAFLQAALTKVLIEDHTG